MRIERRTVRVYLTVVRPSVLVYRVTPYLILKKWSAALHPFSLHPPPPRLTMAQQRVSKRTRSAPTRLVAAEEEAPTAIKCPGFYDEDHFHFCSFSSTDVERPAWVDQPMAAKKATSAKPMPVD